jgi:hypothetical protein
MATRSTTEAVTRRPRADIRRRSHVLGDLLIFPTHVGTTAVRAGNGADPEFAS